MKKAFKYFVFLTILIFAIFSDGFFSYFSLSFVISLSFLLYKKNTTALIICALSGALRDFLFFTLPYFSFLYLYISLGCVWCSEMFLGLSVKKIALIGFFAKLSYHILYFLISALTYADVYFSFFDFSFALFSSALAGIIAPVIFLFFKRFKF